jgi:hypothetical protein
MTKEINAAPGQCRNSVMKSTPFFHAVVTNRVHAGLCPKCSRVSAFLSAPDSWPSIAARAGIFVTQSKPTADGRNVG